VKTADAAARQLKLAALKNAQPETRQEKKYDYQELIMSQYSQSDLREELRTAPIEPLLPVEKKLIVWSLSLGLTLLVVLAAINHFFPVAL
jgi:hypothetical protein